METQRVTRPPALHWTHVLCFDWLCFSQGTTAGQRLFFSYTSLTQI